MTHQEMKLLEDPVPGLLWKIAAPVSFGFFFHTMFNVTDTFYAGKLSAEALAALTICFPLYFIIISFSSGLSSGSTALIAHELGKGNRDKALLYAAQSVSLAFFLSLILITLGLSSTPVLLEVLGAEGAYFDTAYAYMFVLVCGSPCFLFLGAFNAGLLAIGKSKTFGIFLFLGFLLNLVLDPLFLFGLGPIPAMGVAGIGLATILVELFGALFIAHAAWREKLIRFSDPQLFRPRLSTSLDILQQGIPSALNMMTIAFGIFLVTFFIHPYGQEVVAGYGTAMRIEQVVLLPTIGLNIAVLTLVGQNYAAAQRDRVKEVVSKGLRYALYCIMPAVLVFCFPQFCISLFSENKEVIEEGGRYLRFGACIAPAYMIISLFGSSLQGMKHPRIPLFVGIYRQAICPLLLYPLLSDSFGLIGIWWGMLLVMWSAAVIAYVVHQQLLPER